jgi:hypothetical protein
MGEWKYSFLSSPVHPKEEIDHDTSRVGGLAESVLLKEISSSFFRKIEILSPWPSLLVILTEL